MEHESRSRSQTGPRRALPYASTTSAASAVFASAARCRPRRLECAGRTFFECFESSLRDALPEADSTGTHDDPSVSDNAPQPAKLDALLIAVRQGDWYRLLGLENIRYLASTDDIRQAYKRVSLAVHPDRVVRLSPNARQQAHEVFQGLQQALRVLLHPQRRLIYDSKDGDFDDSLPDEEDAHDEAAFYAVFGATFRRNARWSCRQPVPLLGDASTPDDEVLAFYAFWQAFESWREFPSEDADQLWEDQSMTREERRFHERQERKARLRRKQLERARIRQLVERSYRLDPRMRRIREAERQRKAAERAARRRFREQWLEAADGAPAQAQHPAETSLSQNAAVYGEAVRPALRTASVEVDAVASHASTDHRVTPGAQCQTLVQPPGVHEGTGRAGRADALERHQRHRGEFADAGSTTMDAGGDAAALATTAGSNSSSRLSSLSGDAEGSHETSCGVGGCRNGAATVAPDAASTQRAANADAWSAQELALLSRALKKYPAGTRDRWTRIAEALQHRYTPAEIRAQAQALMRAPQSVGQRIASLTPPNVASWTVSEQRQLEEALRRFGASKGAARWQLIASLVPTRSAAACAARFEELRVFYASLQHSATTTTTTTAAAAAAAAPADYDHTVDGHQRTSPVTLATPASRPALGAFSTKRE
jgi:curved DNA-binding protein CbpA